MEMKLLRVGFTDHATEGVLYVDGERECYTLEDAVRSGPKVYGKTAIPRGRYRVGMHLSPKFRRWLPILVDVPGFDYILIHSGNKPADTEGCILVGRDRTELTDAWVGESRLAFNPLFAKIEKAHAAGEEMWIEIAGIRPGVETAAAA